MAEHISDTGYAMIKKEATKGVPLTPNIALPFVRDTLNVNAKIEDVNPIVGLKAMRYGSIKGIREITGDVEVIAEPNTTGYLADMTLTRSSTTGSGPYTHVFGLSAITNPNSYTLDIAKGNAVFRYFGLEADELHHDFKTNKMHLIANCSALGAFTVREIASVASGATSTITLTTGYDANPTLGLVAGDLIRFWQATTGTYTDTTVLAVTGPTTFTVTGANSNVAGDMVTLRPQNVTTSWADWFTFSASQYKFGGTSTAALAATQINIEMGSLWHLFHHFLPKGGVARSGSLNPLSLIRGLGDINFNSKIFFDTPDDYNRFAALYKRAIVAQHYSGPTSQYLMQIVMNNMKMTKDDAPSNINTIIYNDVTWVSDYDATDAQMFGVTLVNNVSSY